MFLALISDIILRVFVRMASVDLVSVHDDMSICSHP